MESFPSPREVSSNVSYGGEKRRRSSRTSTTRSSRRETLRLLKKALEIYRPRAIKSNVKNIRLLATRCQRDTFNPERMFRVSSVSRLTICSATALTIRITKKLFLISSRSLWPKRTSRNGNIKDKEDPNVPMKHQKIVLEQCHSIESSFCIISEEEALWTKRKWIPMSLSSWLSRIWKLCITWRPDSTLNSSSCRTAGSPLQDSLLYRWWIDPLTQAKYMTFPYDSSKSKKEERFVEIDHEVSITEEWSEIELDASLIKMIAHGASSLKPEEPKRLRAPVNHFKISGESFSPKMNLPRCIRPRCHTKEG